MVARSYTEPEIELSRNVWSSLLHVAHQPEVVITCGHVFDRLKLERISVPQEDHLILCREYGTHRWFVQRVKPSPRAARVRNWCKCAGNRVINTTLPKNLIRERALRDIISCLEWVTNLIIFVFWKIKVSKSIWLCCECTTVVRHSHFRETTAHLCGKVNRSCYLGERSAEATA